MDDADWHSLCELLGSKWSLHVLRLLETGSYGFNEMKREIDGMTAPMFSRRSRSSSVTGSSTDPSRRRRRRRPTD